MKIKVTETTWHCFVISVFQGKSAFIICEHSVRHDWQVHFKKPFVHGDNFFHDRDVVSGFDAELLLGRNVVCNILMACYRCF